MTHARKIIAATITAVASSTLFVAWLAGTGTLDWRGLVAVAVTAAAPPTVAALYPDTPGTNGWWPIRKVVAGLVAGLTSSAVFIAWIAGTSAMDRQEVVAIVLAAVLPALSAYMTRENV